MTNDEATFWLTQRDVNRNQSPEDTVCDGFDTKMQSCFHKINSLSKTIKRRFVGDEKIFDKLAVRLAVELPAHRCCVD